MSKVKRATAKPWKVGRHAEGYAADDNGTEIIGEVDGTSLVIAVTIGDVDLLKPDTTAALIVQAVNEHDALIAERDALRDMLKAIKRHGELANVGTGGRFGSKPAGNPMSKDVWQFPRHMLADVDALIDGDTSARSQEK